MTAREALGRVLFRARATVGRSPEQVGDQVGVSGRTIRRLEQGASSRPRRTTLQSLAGYYGLNRGFLLALADWSATQTPDADVKQRIRERAERELGGEVVRAVADSSDGETELVMRLARAPQPGPVGLSALGSGRIQTAMSLVQTLRGPGMPWGTERERVEVLNAVGGLITLDRRRRRVVSELIEQLHDAQAGGWSKGEIIAEAGDRVAAPSGD